MMAAEITALRGTCSRAQVGVVFAKEGRIIMTGYNGAPSGIPHCEHLDDSPCEVSVHAEANAIATAARFGVALDGSTVYTTMQSCLKCAQLLINAGIQELVYSHSYRDQAGMELLIQRGIKVGILPPQLEMEPMEPEEQEGIPAIDWDARI